MDFFQNITTHIMFSPMQQFLSIFNQKAETFFSAVYKQDESIFEMIKTLDYFCFFHILIPLNELMSQILSTEHLLWWNRNISLLDNYDQISGIQNEFHTKATANTLKLEIPYPWSFYTSFANMEALLWDSYPKNLAFFLEGERNASPGKLIPGLFSRQLSENYVKLLSEYALPCLNGVIQQYDKYAAIPNEYESAAIKLAVHLYSSELGFRYASLLSNSLSKILVFREEELTDMRYHAYKEVLLHDDGQSTISTFLSIQWVLQLQDLTRYTKKFLLNGYAECTLRHSLPVLMQCVGLNEVASDLLIEILQQINVRDRSSEIFLLALYRAVSVERYSHRSKMILAIEDIFHSKNIPISLIDVFEDILKFYKALSDELPKRFQPEMLKELIDSASQHDKWFYKIYSLYPACSGDSYLESIKWVYDCIFSGGQLISRMEAHLEQIKDPSIIYSDRILHVDILYKLFYSLASHIDTQIRIAVKPCFECLNIDEKQNPIKDDEVFEFYSRRQHMRLMELDKRLQSEMEHIPAYHTVVQFERIKLEGTSATNQLLKRIENELLAYKLETDSKLFIQQAKIDQLENAQRCTEKIRDYILRYTLSKDTALNQMIMETLISESELTLEFCDSVYKVCENSVSTQISSESLELMRKVGCLLEQAISHPEECQNKILKSDLLTALDNILACVPVINTASNAVKAIISLKKALDSLEGRINQRPAQCH